MNRNIFFLRVIGIIIIGTFFSCHTKSGDDLNSALEAAGANRSTLETVLGHYKGQGDEEKVQAAKYLISNMATKLSIVNRSNRSYFEIFDVIDSLWAFGNAAIIDNRKELESRWDSLVKRHGAPQIRDVDKEKDINIMTADQLISHIDHAFDMWRKNKWSRNVDFESFCKHILPYKVGTEPNELWSVRLYNLWRDTLKENNIDSILNIAKFINDHNAYKMSHMRILWSYPYDFCSSEFERIRLGSCKHGVHYTTQSLRALGIPTAIDFTRRWAGAKNGHEWNVVFLEDGTPYPFDAINKGLKIDLSWRKIAKVYRKTYANQKLNVDFSHIAEIPSELLDINSIDVTNEYVSTKDVALTIDNKERNKYAVISTYSGFDWIPQTWTEISGGKVVFKEMGVGNLYSVFLFNGIDYIRKTEPFLLDSVGGITYFKPSSSKENIRLERKAQLTPFMEDIMSFIVNNKFQGANTRNFQDSVTLFTIEETPKKIESADIHMEKAFRYVRMWIPRGGRGDIAEMEFYGLAKNGQDTVKLSGTIIGDPKVNIEGKRHYLYPFDGDLLTYFLKPRGVDPWVGLDFGSPQKIVKIRYCPRSDTNFIEIGDEYELFYWANGGWKSLGRQKAQDQYLIYKNVPKNCIFILENKSKGVEHKIFIYEDGAQIWM
ncbi:hypothetical protein [Sphingobacterium pedocola]|uniref:Peptide-N(4)-(N-acetyl-beta-glucosaminyl)asparagine amidase n=1 Tax=Sphingobacterium pedocola TaxID=2082722 RepID=A0ABR9TCI6_9SPHI|nr:hypothetical protein [Sphingobacterium pedocola]MBE8722332.1 hypothetical protein [Sphingobacterium pedocola]